jgi:predicted  nucleic acid-binding Zn-ribbon protein
MMDGTMTTGRAVASKAQKVTTRKAPAEKAGVKDVPVKTRVFAPRKAKEKAKNKYIEESEAESDEDAEVDEDEDVEAVEAEKKPIFTVFNTDETLDEGLCVIRSLGEGKYELVNLEYAPRADIGTEETGGIIKAIPGRRDMLAIASEKWEDAKLKAELAVKSAGKLSTSPHSRTR